MEIYLLCVFAYLLRFGVLPVPRRIYSFTVYTPLPAVWPVFRAYPLSSRIRCGRIIPVALLFLTVAANMAETVATEAPPYPGFRVIRFYVEYLYFLDQAAVAKLLYSFDAIHIKNHFRVRRR